MPEQVAYITYNEGVDAKHLHLGNLVHDFKNPNDHDPYIEKSYTDVSEVPPEWIEASPLKNYALCLGKDEDDTDGKRYRVVAAAKATKLEIKDTTSFFKNTTLQSPAKKWISNRLSAAVTLAPHPPPQIWLLTGLVLMTHTTWTSLSSENPFPAAGQQAPFDPTGVSAIRRSSVSEHVRPVFGLDETASGVEEREVAKGVKILETGKYPGTRGWAARWEQVSFKVVGSDKAGNGDGTIQLRGQKVAVVEVDAGEFAEDGDEVGEGDGFDEKYWDALLEAADD